MPELGETQVLPLVPLPCVCLSAIHNFNGLAFVGGFSFSDVLGSAVGWSSSIMLNKDIKYEFKKFYNNIKKFSLGVCNGCQLMARLNWVQNCKFIQNDSKIFESRFSTVKIMKTNSIMLKNMEDIVWGVWVELRC